MRVADAVIQALDSCKYGTLVKVGKKPVGPDSDQVEVWEVFNVTPVCLTMTGTLTVP